MGRDGEVEGGLTEPMEKEKFKALVVAYGPEPEKDPPKRPLRIVQITSSQGMGLVALDSWGRLWQVHHEVDSCEPYAMIKRWKLLDIKDAL